MQRNLFFGFFITIFIIALSFWLIFRNLPFVSLWQMIASLHKGYLFLSFFFLWVFHTCDTLRVWIISKAVGINYSPFYGYLISVVSTFGATITPAHVGGDILPFYTIKRKGDYEFHQIMSVITLKSVAGLFFYIVFLPWTVKALLERPKQAKEFLVILFSILALSGVAFLLWQLMIKNNKHLSKQGFLKRFRKIFFNYLYTCRDFFKNKKSVFLVSVLLSFGLYISLIFIGVFLVKAFSPTSSVKAIFIAQLPLIYAIFISPTPGGSGVGELGALPIFKPFLPFSYLGSFALLWRFISQYLSAAVGGLSLLFLIFKDLPKK